MEAVLFSGVLFWLIPKYQDLVGSFRARRSGSGMLLYPAPHLPMRCRASTRRYFGAQNVLRL